MTKEEELKLKKDRKKFDIREEYFVSSESYYCMLASQSEHFLLEIERES